MPKMLLELKQNCFRARLGHEQRVSTAPVRTDRGSEPPEKRAKAKQKWPASQHTNDIGFSRKRAPTIQLLGATISPIFHLPDPVSPNPAT